MKTTTVRNLFFVVTVLVLSFLIPLTAQATSFIWTGGVNATWAQTTSPYDWSGGSSSNGRYPGMTHTTYTDQATISVTANNPVTLASAVTVGGTGVGPTGDLNYALYIAGTAGTNALNINSGGTLGMQGGINNAQTITINTGGTLQDSATSSGTQYIINGGGTVTLAGGTIGSLGGTWLPEESISGYGTISSPVINFTGGIITANNKQDVFIQGWNIGLTLNR